MGAPLALIRELDSSIEHASDIRRAAMLRHLTDLFIVGAEQYTQAEIDLIDDVFVRLVNTIEESSRALLAVRLGPATKVPPKVLRLLACDDAIEVAAPILTQSECLDIPVLVECAMTKGQDHLLAISRRKIVPEPVSDVLVVRGDAQIVLSVAMNPGAKFSAGGFDMLVGRAQGNDELARCLGTRPDIPPQLFQRLLETASAAVRAKLEAEGTHAKHEIARAVDTAAAEIQAQTIASSERYAERRALVQRLMEAGQLNEAKLEEFARMGRFEEIVAALSLMASVPADIVERTVADTQAESLLVLAKSINLSWDTTLSIIVLAARRFKRTTADIEKHMAAYERLTPTTAHRILDFYRLRKAAPPRKQ